MSCVDRAAPNTCPPFSTKSLHSDCPVAGFTFANAPTGVPAGIGSVTPPTVIEMAVVVVRTEPASLRRDGFRSWLNALSNAATRPATLGSPEYGPRR